MKEKCRADPLPKGFESRVTHHEAIRRVGPPQATSQSSFPLRMCSDSVSVPMIVLHEEIFVTAVDSKSHCCYSKPWKGAFEPIPSSEGTFVSPFFPEDMRPVSWILLWRTSHWDNHEPTFVSMGPFLLSHQTRPQTYRYRTQSSSPVEEALSLNMP